MSATENTPLLAGDTTKHVSPRATPRPHRLNAMPEPETNLVPPPSMNTETTVTSIDHIGESEEDLSNSNVSTMDASLHSEDGLMGTKAAEPVTLSERLREYSMAEIPSDMYLQGQLQLYAFTTGIIDLTTLINYGCFASKQTGNTVFLALRFIKHPLADEERVNIYFSLGFFLLGIAAFGHLGHLINPKRRIALFSSASTQTTLVWIATALVCFVSDRDDWPISAIVVAMLAVQCGGQIALSIQMARQELNTTMVTGALINIVNDPNLLKAANPGRNRRILFVVCFWLGCATGAGVSKHWTPRHGFVMYAICKTLLGLSFLFNPAIREAEQEDSTDARRRRSGSPIFRIIWGDT